MARLAPAVTAWSEHRVVRRGRHHQSSCEHCTSNYFQQAGGLAARAPRAAVTVVLEAAASEVPRAPCQRFDRIVYLAQHAAM